MRAIIGIDGIVHALQSQIRASEHQPAREVIGMLAHVLFELRHHGEHVWSGHRRSLYGRVPIPMRPQGIQTGCGARDQARRKRPDDAASLVAQQRYRNDGCGNRSHESCDDEEGAHSSSGMRERWRTTRKIIRPPSSNMKKGAPQMSAVFADKGGAKRTNSPYRSVMNLKMASSLLPALSISRTCRRRSAAKSTLESAIDSF